MLKSSLVSKFLIFILALCAAFVGSAYVIHSAISDAEMIDFNRESRDLVKKTGYDLAAPMWLKQKEYVMGMLETLNNYPNNTFARLTDSSGIRYQGFSDSAYDSLINASLQNGVTISGNDSLLVLMTKVRYNSEFLGWLVSGFSKEEVLKTQSNRLNWLLTYGLGVTGLALLFGTLFIYSALRWFKASTADLQTHRIDVNGLSIRMKEGGSKEFVDFAKAFNSLAENVEKNLDYLQSQPPDQQRFFMQNPVGMLITDTFWNIKFANTAAKDLFGVEVDILTKRNMEDLLPSNEILSIFENLKDDGNNINDYVVQVVTNDKKKFDLEITPFHDELSSIESYLIVVKEQEAKAVTLPVASSDISVEKMEMSVANQALQDEVDEFKEKYYDQEKYVQKIGGLINGIRNVLTKSDLNALFETFSKALTDILGSVNFAVFQYDAMENKLNHVANPVFSPFEISPISENDGAVWSTFSTRNTFVSSKLNAFTKAELKLPSSNYSIFVMPISEQKNLDKGVIAIWQNDEKLFTQSDVKMITPLIHAFGLTKLLISRQLHSAAAVTEQKTDEVAFIDAFRQHKMDSLEILIGGLAHDFNNIFGIIVPNVDLLRMKFGTNPVIMKRVKSIQDAVERATRLTGQMVVFTRSDNLNIERIQVNSILERIVTMLQRSFDDSIHFDLELNTKLPKILADETQLSQAFVNLAMNSRDAMPGGGILSIRSFLAENVQNDGSEAKTYACIEIQDTGKGISEADLLNIFDPFFTTKPPRTGSGMGLAVVHGIIKSHNGIIRVNSKLSKGTTFQIYLPIAEVPKAVAVETAPVKNGNGNGKQFLPEPIPKNTRQILIVDDEEMVRESLRESLEYLGYSVTDADSGEAALQIMNDIPNLSAAIVDFAMPGMGGIRTIAGIKKVYPKMRIVLSSGYPEQRAAVERSKSIHAFLQKPYTLDQLEATLVALFKEKTQNAKK